MGLGSGVLFAVWIGLPWALLRCAFHYNCCSWLI